MKCCLLYKTENENRAKKLNHISYPDTVVGLLQMIKNSIVHSNSMALPSSYNS